MRQLLIGISSKLIRLQVISIRLLRIAIAIVLIWIGSLKYFDYESEGIVPYVANSPLMNFFYAHPEMYKDHLLKEGEFKKENFDWHEDNHTHIFGLGLGILIVVIATLLLLNNYSPVIGMIGSALVIVMSLTTLSFLITTPESWVPALGDPAHGFPLLAARGRLVVKDAIMMAGGFVALCDSARMYLLQRVYKEDVEAAINIL
ncbi:MAG: DUF417 family protein [Ferruginibacter sp.]